LGRAEDETDADTGFEPDETKAASLRQAWNARVITARRAGNGSISSTDGRRKAGARVRLSTWVKKALNEPELCEKAKGIDTRWNAGRELWLTSSRTVRRLKREDRVTGGRLRTYPAVDVDIYGYRLASTGR
jgi:hypothetical protein